MNTLFYKAFLPRFYEQSYEQSMNNYEQGLSLIKLIHDTSLKKQIHDNVND